jgi:hypothetical protein
MNMKISENLIRQLAKYLEVNAKDPTGQALLQQLRFVLEVNSAPPTEGGKYSVNSDRASTPSKVQGQSTVKLRDFVRHKTIFSWFGQVSKISEGEATVTLEDDGLVVSAPLDDWEVVSNRK